MLIFLSDEKSIYIYLFLNLLGCGLVNILVGGAVPFKFAPGPRHPTTEFPLARI